MRSIAKTMLAVLILSIAACDCVEAQTFSAPKSVDNGEMIPFVVEGFQSNDQVTWRVLHPRGIAMKRLETSSKMEFVVDPPIGYVGTVEVMCTILNWETKKFHQDELTVQVGKGKPKPPDPKPDDPAPDPNPDPDPDDDSGDDEYTGPNEFGVGQVSFDSAPGFHEEVPKIFSAAAMYLKGDPKLKVIYTQNQQLNQSEYNVNRWISAELKRKGITGTEWNRWHRQVYARISEVSGDRQLSTNDWFNIFVEVREGINAKRGDQ